MSDNKKYYYMRVKENFFDSDEMLILESMPDGYLYSNILLKMYLRSLKCNGFLLLNDYIPMNAQMIATITKHPVGVVRDAINIFQTLGLIDVLDDGRIYMSNIELFIGQSSTEGDRKKAARLALKNQSLIEDGQMSDIHPPYIEIEIEKEIDTDIEIEKETEKPAKAVKRFCKPSIDEIKDYIWENDLHVDAETFFDYYEANGWKAGKNPMKDWKATLRNWERREKKVTPKATTPTINWDEI